MTTVTISDDFDLKKIADSGQSFRIKPLENGTFRFISGSEILYIRKLSGKDYEISTFSASGSSSDIKKWNGIWADYFDLSRDYSSIRKLVPASDTFLNEACKNGKGLRILRQDPWEMIISFIISQRKSIPAIKRSIEEICRRFGTCVDTGKETLFLFPSAKELSGATEAELKDCGLGYRVPYIIDAVSRVSRDEINPYGLYSFEYDELFLRLKEIKGVGDKVSNCICLFAYGKTEAAPVDTWIAKVIEKKYAGINPFPPYGENAGIMQQYIFYYALTHKDNF